MTTVLSCGCIERNDGRWLRCSRHDGAVPAVPNRPRNPAKVKARKPKKTDGRARTTTVTPTSSTFAAPPRIVPSKDEAKCCLAKRLPDGRPVIGFCGPNCERRP